MRKTAASRSADKAEGGRIAYDEVERRMRHARQLRAEHLGATIASLLGSVHSAAKLSITREYLPKLPKMQRL